MPVVHFDLNGRAVCIEVDGKELLVDTLRKRFLLTGTKKACGTDDCGACTELIDNRAVRSCAYLTCMVEGRNVMTIEGLGTPWHLHPLQQAFIDAGAVQCGYCTPGMIMTVYGLLEEKENPDEEEIRMAISGNLCRCTGYQKIVNAVKLAAERRLMTANHSWEEIK